MVKEMNTYLIKVCSVKNLYVYNLKYKSLSWYKEGFYELVDVNKDLPGSPFGHDCGFKNIYTGDIFRSFYNNMVKLDDDYSTQIRRDALLEKLI